jgi:hypothetical protein
MLRRARTATATTAMVIALGLIRRLFTPDHRLISRPAPAGRRPG